MELFHVLNRGVDKRNIVQDDTDRMRFVHDLWEFNDNAPVNNLTHSLHKAVGQPYGGARRSRQQLVDIHAWCLMGNHYHLLLSERTEGGLSKFIKKLNGGYAQYFNNRHGRSGALWQGKTKKKHIDSDAYFLHILFYIHLNPLDLCQGAESWRSRRVESIDAAIRHLRGYRWSSHLDYLSSKNFPSIISTELFRRVFPNYEVEVREHLEDIDISEYSALLLEQYDI